MPPLVLDYLVVPVLNVAAQHVDLGKKLPRRLLVLQHSEDDQLPVVVCEGDALEPEGVVA